VPSLTFLLSFVSSKVDIRSGAHSVENSPFPLNVVEPEKAVVRLRQPEEAENKYLVRRELDIALDAGEGTHNLSSHVEGPDGENVPSSCDKGDDGLYHVKFVPYQPGTYKVGIFFSLSVKSQLPHLIKLNMRELWEIVACLPGILEEKIIIIFQSLTYVFHPPFIEHF